MARNENGWFLVTRKMFLPDCQNNEFFGDPALTLIWLQLISWANFKDGKGAGGEIVLRGQVLTSYSELGKTFGYGKQVVRRCLKYLVDNEKINTLTNTRGIVVTILNYDKYQDPKEEANTPTNTRPTRDQHATNTMINKVNKEKKEKKENISLASLPAGQRDLATKWIEFHKRHSKVKTEPNEEEYAKAIVRLEKLGITTDSLTKALVFVEGDDFWRPNALSLPKLLAISKTNGLRKIENILNAMERSASTVQTGGIPQITEESFNEWMAKNGVR